MVRASGFIRRIIFFMSADRLGPDMPLTHLYLHFKGSMNRICRKKFKYFGVGAEFRPGAYAEACSKISIGNSVIIRPGTFLFADPAEGGGSITIEEKVLMGPGIHMYTNNHEYSNGRIPIYDQGYPKATSKDSIILRRGCWIGANVILLPGVEIGENSVVAAGSVVTKKVEPNCVVAGNPAKLVRIIKN